MDTYMYACVYNQHLSAAPQPTTTQKHTTTRNNHPRPLKQHPNTPKQIQDHFRAESDGDLRRLVQAHKQQKHHQQQQQQRGGRAFSRGGVAGEGEEEQELFGLPEPMLAYRDRGRLGDGESFRVKVRLCGGEGCLEGSRPIQGLVKARNGDRTTTTTTRPNIQIKHTHSFD